MRINELITESEVLDEITRPSDLNAAHAILKKAGYSRIGNGMYANVYAKATDEHVLKLFKSSDEAYKQFVNMVVQNPNVHFPKFKGKLMRITDEYYAIRMEKLQPLNMGYDYANSVELSTVLTAYIYNYTSSSRVRLAPTAEKTKFRETMNRLIDETEEKQPGIKKACELVASLLSGNRLDLHPGNIMMRGPVVVITDPVN